MVSVPEHVPVVIIGGGIGGLTLGALLRRLDIPFVILERAPVVSPQGAGISLAPNCLRVLEQLGLLQAIRANSQELFGVRVYREKNYWGTIDFGLARRWFGYNVHSIERHEFHRYLYEAAGGAETVRFGWNVANIVDADSAHTPVQVVSDDGRIIHADVVAGADGIRSATRRIVRCPYHCVHQTIDRSSLRALVAPKAKAPFALQGESICRDTPSHYSI